MKVASHDIVFQTEVTPNQSCRIIDPTCGSGRVGWGRIGSENLEGCTGRVGSGPDGLRTHIWRHKLVIKCCLICISCRIWHCIMRYIILGQYSCNSYIFYVYGWCDCWPTLSAPASAWNCRHTSM